MLKQLTSRALVTTTAFARSSDGNIGIMSALLTPLLLMSAGFAVNVAHVYNTRASMSQTLDAALTSTTREVIVNGQSKSVAKAAMEDFIGANGNASLAQADKLTLTELDIDRTSRVVTAQMKSDVKLPFPVFGMSDTWPVVVAAATAYNDRPVEVAMMLDLTGSMNERGTPKNGRTQTKLDNLKDAASSAVKDLLSRNRPGQRPRVRIALVPYSQGVNAGSLSEANYIEDGARRIADAPIGLDELNLPANRPIKLVQDLLRPATDKCTTERKVMSGGSLTADFSDNPPETAMINRDKRMPANSCPRASVTPLSSDEDKLLDQISRFAGIGGTAGHIGVQWTRYVLSPKWGSFLSARAGSDAIPAVPASGPTAVRKVAILLTDGEFNTQYASGGNSAGMAQAHCNLLKQGVEVFTIGFMLRDNAAKATMAACASPDTNGGIKHYYDASNAAELNAAFQAISANTEVIRLTN